MEFFKGGIMSNLSRQKERAKRVPSPQDHLTDIMWNVAGCLRESGEFKNEWLEMDIFDEE